jgi:hypothetical protein
MAGINYPLWVQLKTNLVTILTEIATEENIVDTARNFTVGKDRWRPWIEAQQKVSLVNIMVTGVGQDSGRSGNRTGSLDEINVVVDMYALGKAGEILPADQIAADRIDLLTAQVREGLTRFKNMNLGFTKDPVHGWQIDRNINFALTYYDQENEQSTGQYAPARWSFDVKMPFIPTDNNDYVDLDELNVSVKKGDLENFALRFNYDT